MDIIRARSTPISSERPAATGARATIVPTDVPTDIEMKQAATNIPAGRKRPGTRCKVKATVASTAPTAFADAANMPASTNIHTIYIMLESAAPAENIPTRSLKGFPGTTKMEYTAATTNDTQMGMP